GQLIESYREEEVILMGSSLGGFFAIYLAEKYGLKAVLINPAVDSSKTLKRVLNLEETAKNYYDNSHFTWNETHVTMLLNYRVTEIKNGRYFLLTQTGDEVLDYQEAVEKLSGHKMMIEEGGDHAFVNIENYFDEVKAFILS
ncbi:MAG TPA: esterase, partial [Campylobacterales bacterium]|nr:esterase [Campylobacterales bacterium]